MTESVKVAVRVRPFNLRQKNQGAQLCVYMNGNMTQIRNTQNKTHKFFFDFCYWSHDQFIQSQSGLYIKNSPTSRYADQASVFQDLGFDLIQNAWQGYHCTLFAYGQTGSGKSYSIFGYQGNKGIVPVACQQIFSRVNQQKNPLIQHDIKVSMLQIYNQQVQDLLKPANMRVNGGLKLRQRPGAGVFVQGISLNSVSSFNQVYSLLQKGNQNKSIAATQMNATSSRAHTVLTINFSQIFYDQFTGQPLNRKQSTINLVDLSGSQRAGKSGATGQRLVQGSNINKSLSTLGKVISTLAKKAVGEAVREVIPYRESKLTRLLQNALGGNSKTIMIAAISPSMYNYSQSLSTLRYADQVKAIKNKAVVNQTPQDKLIRELREQNQHLKSMLENRLEDNKRRYYQDLIDQLRKEKEEAEKTIQQKESENKMENWEQAQSNQVNTTHLQNLNQDPMLTGYIKHPIFQGTNTIGKNESCNLVIKGLKIGQIHCRLFKSGQTHLIIPSQDSQLKTMLNGQNLYQQRPLNHQDRLRLGNNSFWVFIDPQISNYPQIDYEQAQKQANYNQILRLRGQREQQKRIHQQQIRAQLQGQVQQVHLQLEASKKQIENLKFRTDQDAKLIRERQEQLNKKHREMQQQLKRRQREIRKKQKARIDNNRLEQVVSHAIQICNQANQRSSILGNTMRFHPQFISIQGPNGILGIEKDSLSMRIKLKLPGLLQENIYWSTEELQARIPDMADMCQQYLNGAALQEIDIGYDPFSIDLTEINSLFDQSGFIGQAKIPSSDIYNLLDIQETLLKVFDFYGEVGEVLIEIIPLIPGEDMEQIPYQNLNELIGRQIDIEIRVKKASRIRNQNSVDVYCQFLVQAFSERKFMTNKKQGNSPVWNFKTQVSGIITEEVAEIMESGYVFFNLFGNMPQEFRCQARNKVSQAVLQTRAQQVQEIKKPVLNQFPEEPEQESLSQESKVEMFQAMVDQKEKAHVMNYSQEISVKKEQRKQIQYVKEQEKVDRPVQSPVKQNIPKENISEVDDREVNRQIQKQIQHVEQLQQEKVDRDAENLVQQNQNLPKKITPRIVGGEVGREIEKLSQAINIPEPSEVQHSRKSGCCKIF